LHALFLRQTRVHSDVGERAIKRKPLTRKPHHLRGIAVGITLGITLGITVGKTRPIATTGLQSLHQRIEPRMQQRDTQPALGLRSANTCACARHEGRSTTKRHNASDFSIDYFFQCLCFSGAKRYFATCMKGLGHGLNLHRSKYAQIQIFKCNAQDTGGGFAERGLSGATKSNQEKQWRSSHGLSAYESFDPHGVDD